MRIVLGIEYNGSRYYGWQAQENLPTIQGCLETALSRVANEPITLFCAGRTDAGVHATGQIAHFDTQAERTSHAWIFGANTYLPDDIVLFSAFETTDHFHARHSALSRRYHYLIYNHPTPSALWASSAAFWRHSQLDELIMDRAAQALLGEHDFSSFRSSQCESKTPIREILAIHVRRKGRFVMLDIQANAFLHHMVRNIAGTLIRIGAGEYPPDYLRNILESKDRKQAFETASPSGLYLVEVRYPSEFSIPHGQNSFLFDGFGV